MTLNSYYGNLLIYISLMEPKHKFDTVAELLDALAPYISARALARICGMSESQMLQYKAGLKQISPRNIARINEKLRTFAAELSAMSLKGA